MASAMPVLPLVGSVMVSPGRRGAAASGAFPHPQPLPVLHAAGRVAVFHLGPQPHLRAGREARQADQRRVSARVEQGLVARHGDQLRKACAAANANAPPATAGRIVTWSPSLSLAS